MPPLSRLLLSIPTLLATATLALPAATTIDVGSTPVTSSVKRFGMNLSFHTTYDSRLMMKELAFRNPGFEGLTYQSAIRAASGTATGFTDDSASTQWPDGFWNGATYECVWGAAKGRTGTIASFTRAPVGQSSVGSTFGFDASGLAVGAGDQFILRMQPADSPATGWQANLSNAAITAEFADHPADTPGRQALHAASTGANAQVQLSNVFDNALSPGISFIQLNGRHRVTFKAKSLGGAVSLGISVRRGNTTLHTANLPLATTWTTHTTEFTATEDGSARGIISLQFTLTGTFDVLLDDVSFVQTDSDPANPTAFRDAVVSALRLYQPGILRGWQECLGESLDNQLAPMHARRRAGYSAFATSQNQIQYGYHEFLELCEHLGAEPWIVIPVIFTTQEMANLMEYLGGGAGTPYGGRRAARGHPTPWTEVFSRIHIEFGNEAWNGPTYLGGVMGFANTYGNRASEIFGAARNSPYFSSAKFEFVLGAHSVETARLMNIHNASTNHDVVAVDGYFYTSVDSFANDEELFAPLFAQSEYFNKTGYLAADYQGLQGSAHRVPLAIYEGNINVTRGQIGTSQAALTALTPSLGAGLAVANDMLMKLRDLKIRDQCLFALGGYEFQNGSNWAFIWGVTRDLGVTNRKRPSFLATQLANEAILGDLVQTTHRGDDPTWSQVPINQVPSTYSAHYLHSYAFAAPDGRRSLVVFNLHRTSALAVNFTGANAPAGNVTIRQLTSTRITDNNEDAENVIPTIRTVGDFSATQDFSLPPYSMTVYHWSTSTATTPTSPPPPTPAAPTITMSPQNQAVTIGHEATLTATASAGALQWQISADAGATWTNLPNNSTYSGVSTGTLTIGGATASSDNTRYRLVATTAGGTATSNAATLTVVPAFFPHPTAIAFDGTGSYFVADASANTLQQVDGSSQVSVLAGTAGAAGSADATGAAARFNQPGGTVIAPAGVLFVADTANATIRRIGTDGAVTTFAGSATFRGNTDATGAAATFSAPLGLARDAGGNLYVADSTNHTLRKISPTGAVTTLAGSAGNSGAIDATGGAARFNLPSGIAVDAAGAVYVADTNNNTIRRVAPDGTATTLAGLAGISGATDGTGNNALFSHPVGIALDSSGLLYVADTNNNTIRRVTAAGVVTTLAGLPRVSGLKDGTGPDAWFNQPQALAVDSAGNLYVADTGNAAIRRVTPAGIVTTLVYTAAPPNSGSGTAPGNSGSTGGTGSPGGATAPPPSSGGSGGGGSLSYWFLFTLGSAALLRRWQQVSRPPLSKKTTQ
ncbi:MAG: hypothetical protein HYV95_00615 [Opitutae bacterium]|nr:hypothetical protein [Opitutae bacterium]